MTDPEVPPAGTTIRVVLADDQALVRMGMRVLLESEPGIEVVGEASDGAEAVRVVGSARPDVLVLDVRMPVLDGIGALREIAADPTLAATRIVVLTTFEQDEYVFAALRAGASGFLIKDTDPSELVRAIRLIAAGESLLSPTVTRRVIGRFAALPVAADAVHPRLDSLTSREREMVTWVTQGLSNAEIADRLVLSPATVRTHVGRAMIKLGARDRAQLVVFGYQSGLAHPGDG